MENLTHLFEGFGHALTPANLLFSAIGVLLGTAIGVLPGIGPAIGLVGLDPLSGQARLTFGIPQLADGIDVVIVAVGLFAVGEALWVAAHLRRTVDRPIPVGRPWLSRDDVRRTWKPWLRGP